MQKSACGISENLSRNEEQPGKAAILNAQEQSGAIKEHEQCPPLNQEHTGATRNNQKPEHDGAPKPRGRTDRAGKGHGDTPQAQRGSAVRRGEKARRTTRNCEKYTKSITNSIQEGAQDGRRQGTGERPGCWQNARGTHGKDIRRGQMHRLDGRCTWCPEVTTARRVMPEPAAGGGQAAVRRGREPAATTLPDQLMMPEVLRACMALPPNTREDIQRAGLSA